MKTIQLYILMLFTFGQLSAQNLNIPGLEWDDAYSFDKCNSMKVEFFSKNKELMQTLVYKTFYTGTETKTTESGLVIPQGNFSVFLDAPSKGNDIEVIFDMAHEVTIQIYASDAPEPMYTAGMFKFPETNGIKKLELVPTDETKTIAGHLCRRYTYQMKRIFGSVWITTEVRLPNDYGIFRAGKMTAKHNTLSVEGFVMEMTSEDATGAKTIMTTVSLGNSEKRTVSLPRDKMGKAINKASYFSF